MSFGERFRPSRLRRDANALPFSGWRIVALCSLALALTAPGQTTGVSVFVDPMIEGLGLTRSQVSTTYMIGTLVGALGLRPIGRLVDAQGARRAMLLVAGGFGLALVGMAGVNGPITLTLGFVGIRMLGQGGLSLVATTAPARWFNLRRGFAIGTTTAVGSGLISLVPIGAAVVIAALGWRSTWLIFGVLVWVVVLPIARWGLVDRPEDVGQQIDGLAPAPPTETESTAPAPQLELQFTLGQALRTPMFWVLSGALASTSMIATGMSFQQIDLLGEQGLSSIEAAANFLPQTIAGLAVTMATGALIDRFPERATVVGSMLLLMGAMVGVGFVRPGFTSVLYGLVLGAAQASVRALEGASFPKVFGTAHVGEIRGVVKGIMVASSAFGPLALSLGYDMTNDYQQVLRLLLLLPATVVVVSLLVAQPSPQSAPGS